MAEAFEESDLRAGLKEGGRILGAFIVVRGGTHSEEFVIYIRTDWVRGRGFRILRSWRGGSGDRSFKSLDKAWHHIRKFDFLGRIIIYPQGDPDLHQFVGVGPEDLMSPAELSVID